MGMKWALTKDGDPRGRALADRHYSRTTVGAKLFVHPAKKLVLIHLADYLEGADAVWASTWPFAEYVRHDWAGEPGSYPMVEVMENGQPRKVTPGTWNNALFRNESRLLSSDLIRQAVAVTRCIWGDPPPLGMVTMIEPASVRQKETVGRAYLAAGFQHVGVTRSGEKQVFLLMPDDMPEPKAPRRSDLVLFRDA
jgi:hypothetical protein